MYILTVLDVAKRIVTITNIENDRLRAINSMLEYINRTTEKDSEYEFHECVHVSDFEIHIYKRSIGYVASSKTLDSQVKVIQYEGYYTTDDEDTTVVS